MNIFQKLLRRLRPPVEPQNEAEAQRMRETRETIRTSQLSARGGSNLPPTSDITTPRR